MLNGISINLKQVLLLLLVAVGSCLAERSSFNDDWKFALGDPEGAEPRAFADDNWRVLDVPHDWSIEGEYSQDHPMGDQGGYLPAGIGWYHKTIAVPQDWKGKHVEIAFDGVFMNSTVWANGQQLGARPYGWSSFAYGISEVVQGVDSITFAVRVDNSKQPSARWYTGSGIYAYTSFQEWWQRDVTDWIKRDRNHLSIVIYSVGNETRGSVAKDLVALCHELAPTRPVNSGHSGSQARDVYGVNGSSETLGWFDHLKQDRVFIGTEHPHTWLPRLIPI